MIFCQWDFSKAIAAFAFQKENEKKMMCCIFCKQSDVDQPISLIMFSPFYFNVEMHRQRGLHFQKLYMAFNKNCCQITSFLKRDTEFSSSVV